MPFPLSKPYDEQAVSLARNGHSTLETVAYQGEPVRVLTFPAFNPEDHRIDAVVQFSYWLGDINRTLNTLAGALLLILPIGIVLMGSASMFVVGRALKPVKDIGAATAQIQAGNLSGRIPVSGNDEFSELAVTVNAMLGRLDRAFASQELTLAQLREVVLQQRRFTADASHELKTPLTIIKVNTSLLKPSLRDQDSIELAGAIDEAVNRMSKLVQDLLLLARTDSGQLTQESVPVELNALVEHAASQVACSAEVKVIKSADPLTVQGSPSALERVVTNLLDNACRHSGPSGHVEVRVHKASGICEITVTDDGEGIPPEHLTKIFERFHRVDSSRNSGTGGTGLGLAICKGIVEAHRGSLSVESTPDVKTVFTVGLPLG